MIKKPPSCRMEAFGCLWSDIVKREELTFLGDVFLRVAVIAFHQKSGQKQDEAAPSFSEESL